MKLRVKDRWEKTRLRTEDAFAAIHTNLISGSKGNLNKAPDDSIGRMQKSNCAERALKNLPGNSTGKPIVAIHVAEQLRGILC